MIKADLRSRLTAPDLRLMVLLLGGGSATRRAAVERQLETEGPDSLLDSPDLAERLRAVHSLLIPSEPLFMYVMVRQALVRAGVTDRGIADYLASLLVDFGRRDRAHRVDWNDDAHHSYLVDIVRDLESTSGERRFKVMLHLGNYALWLAGIYPDYIAARRARHGGPDLPYYDALGQRGFVMASDHELADRLGMEEVLAETAARYRTIRGALNGVSDQYFFPTSTNPRRLGGDQAN